MSATWRDADDPAIVLERKQRRCCHGCQFLQQDRTPGFEKFTCSKGVRKAVRDLYEAERCVRYSEKKPPSKAVKKSKRPYDIGKEY